MARDLIDLRRRQRREHQRLVRGAEARGRQLKGVGHGDRSGMIATKVMASNRTSHHRPDGGYRNPWPDAQPAGFRAFLRWQLAERRRLAPNPARDSLPRRTPLIVAPRAERGYRAA